MLNKLVKPYLSWIKLGIVVALIVSAYCFGSSNKKTELTLAYAEAYQNQFEHYKAIETASKERTAKLDEEYTRELFDAQDTIDNIIDDVSNGKRGLFVKTNKAECDLPETAKSASLDDGPGRARLDQNTAREIIRLTARGDRAIIKLTACQKYIKGLE